MRNSKGKKIIFMLLLGLILSTVSISAATALKITYNGKTVTYKDKQLKATLNGSNINISKTPGLLEDGYALLPYKAVFVNSPIKATSVYNKSAGTLEISYKNNTIKMTLGKKTAYVNGVKKTMPVAPRKVTYVNSKTTCILVPSRFVTESLGLTYKWISSTSTVAITKKGIDLKYDGTWKTYTGTQSQITVDGKKVSSAVPGIVVDKVSLVPAKSVFYKSVGASYDYNSKTKVLTLKKNNNTVTLTMGSNIAYVNGVKKTMSTKARVVYYNERATWYVMVPASFVTKSLGLTYQWVDSSKTCKIILPKSSGSIASMSNTSDTELKAMWISYLEFGTAAKTEAQFKTMVNTMFDNCVSYGMNAVVVQVRPLADALYPSKYFPWSKYISGTQGKAVSYDPLEYMIEAAHERNLEFHAWINPYRITIGSTDYSSLSEDNPARLWHESEDADIQRNVLSYNGQLYFNPAKSQVRTLIVNGIKEIVNNYQVDGIHMDDYFYPTFSSSNVNTAFDAKEYKAYVEENKSNGTASLSIANWRRNNVNTLVKRIYKEIKAVDEGIAFGISPAANLGNLRSSLQHYVDIDTWMSNSGYVDYVCPQIYWGFDYGNYSYDIVQDQWAQLNTKQLVKLYSGIAVYKAGSSSTSEWKNNTDILKRQIEYTRDTDNTNGFMFFRYDYFLKSATQKELDNMLPLLK